MAETKEHQQAAYPLPVYNFRVTVGGTAMSFAEVAGLVIEYETVTYRHGLSFWEGETIAKVPANKAVPVTLKRGTVKGLAMLSDWLIDDSARPLEVSLCDERGQPVVTWKAERAVPVKLEAPAFDAKSDDVAIESLEVMASGISVEHH